MSLSAFIRGYMVVNTVHVDLDCRCFALFVSINDDVVCLKLADVFTGLSWDTGRMAGADYSIGPAKQHNLIDVTVQNNVT